MKYFRNYYAAFCLLAYFMTCVPAYAYIDPGTGSIMLQLLLGGVGGLLVVGKLYWGKIKTFFQPRKKDNSNDKDEKG